MKKEVVMKEVVTAVVDVADPREDMVELKEVAAKEKEVTVEERNKNKSYFQDFLPNMNIWVLLYQDIQLNYIMYN